MTRTTPQTCPFPLEDQHPYLILGPTRVFLQNSMSIGSAIVHSSPQSVPLLYNVPLRSPKIAPSPWGFRHPARGGPSHGHGNMHRKIGKDRACGSWQTDRHTDMLIAILRHRSRGRSY